MPVGVAGRLAVAADGDDAEHRSDGVRHDRGLRPDVSERVLRGRDRLLAGRDALDAAEPFDDLNGRGPVARVVVGVGVPLHPVSRDRGFQRVAVLNRHQDAEEVRRRDEWVHPVGVRAPGAVVSLLEQPAGVGSYRIAVVDDAQAGLAHRGHDADRLVTRGQAESVRCLHDPRGVDELLVVVAGDGRVRNGVRVDRDAWLLRAGQAQIVAVVATQQDEAEHEAQDQGGDERGDDEDA
ncbi:hypothetical protein [Paenarthrobacter sp. YJN-D]|uniref:hypothetical protein n=1 Tax=Paenarthrobacter sp. YJN-D TaxID=2735317 RepID=UPI00351C27DD